MKKLYFVLMLFGLVFSANTLAQPGPNHFQRNQGQHNHFHQNQPPISISLFGPGFGITLGNQGGILPYSYQAPQPIYVQPQPIYGRPLLLYPQPQYYQLPQLVQVCSPAYLVQTPYGLVTQQRCWMEQR